MGKTIKRASIKTERIKPDTHNINPKTDRRMPETENSKPATHKLKIKKSAI